MSTNLGSLLQEAGVRGGRRITPKTTGLTMKYRPSTPFTFDTRHMKSEFRALAQARNGDDFVRLFEGALRQLNPDDPIAVRLIDVTNLANMARHLRDIAQGGAKKSFNPVVKLLLELEQKMRSRQVGGDSADYIEEQLKTLS